MNRYDVISQSPTGLDPGHLPINEMMASLASKQKQQDDMEKKIADQNTFLTNLEDGYHTQGLSNEIREKYKPILDELLNQNLTETQGKRALYNATSQITSDPNVRLNLKDSADKKMRDELYTKNPDWTESAIDYGKDPSTGNYIQARDKAGNWIAPESYTGYANKMFGYKDWTKPIDELAGKMKDNISEITGAGGRIQYDNQGNMFAVTKDNNVDKVLSDKLKQYQSALNSLTDQYYEQKGPEGQYLAKLSGYRGQGYTKDNVRKIINERMESFTYNQHSQNEKWDYQKPGKEGETPSLYNINTPINVKTPQLTDMKGQVISDPISFINSTRANNYISTKGEQMKSQIIDLHKDYPTNNFKSITGQDGHTYIIPIDDSGNRVSPNNQGLSLKLEKMNQNWVAQDQKFDAYKKTVNGIMQEHGYDPNKDITTQISNTDAEVYQKSIAEVGRMYMQDHPSDQYGSSGYSEQDLKTYADKALNSGDPRYASKLTSELTSRTRNPNLIGLVNDINDAKNGITYTVRNGIPLVEGLLKDKPIDQIYSAVEYTLKDPNAFDKGGVIDLSTGQTLNSSEGKDIVSNVEDKYKEDWGKLIKNNGQLFFNEAKNEYEIALRVPTKDKTYNIAIRANQVNGLGDVANRIDPRYNSLYTQGSMKKFYTELAANNGTFAYSPTGEDYPTNYKIPTMTAYKDEKLNNDGESIQKGDHFFTLPDTKDIIFIPHNIQDYGRFADMYNHIKNEGSITNPSTNTTYTSSNIIDMIKDLFPEIKYSVSPSYYKFHEGNLKITGK